MREGGSSVCYSYLGSPALYGWGEGNHCYMETRGPLEEKRHPRETVVRKVWHAALQRGVHLQPQTQSQTHTHTSMHMSPHAHRHSLASEIRHTRAHGNMAWHTEHPPGLSLIDLEQYHWDPLSLNRVKHNTDTHRQRQVHILCTNANTNTQV